MRTQETINGIKKTFSDPYAISNFVNSEDIDYLIELYDNASNKIYKNTGPVTLSIKDSTDPVISKIYSNIEKEIGPYAITAAIIFYTAYPHIIHNDDTYELPHNVYKAIAIPLKIYGSKLIPKLCFFDQHYFHGPAKFFNGDSSISTHYNEQIYSYEHVDGISDSMFFNKTGYFTHLKPQWLSGLSLHSVLSWKPGDAIIFDSVRLHCASDFRNLGITGKLGISIFTKKIS